jgi:hypothetical protein
MRGRRDPHLMADLGEAACFRIEVRLYHLGQRNHPRPELPILRTKTPLAVVYAISGGACTAPLES